MFVKALYPSNGACMVCAELELDTAAKTCDVKLQVNLASRPVLKKTNDCKHWSNSYR